MHLWLAQYYCSFTNDNYFSNKEKEKYENLKECIDFSQVEKYEQEKLLRDKIIELNDKWLSLEEKDKWKQKHELQPEKT